MSKDQPLRVGIIGAGANTRLQHLPGFQKIPGVEVTVLCNRTEASGRKVADEFGVSRVETDWRAVVDDPEVDAICIGTWPYMHAEVTIAALEAGKHVLTEARMARDLAEAEAMLQAAEEHSGLVAQIVPAPFSLNHDATIVRLLTELGPLREVSVVHRCGMWTQPETPTNWRQDFEFSGKNTQTLGILYETVQRWLGPTEDPAWLLADAELFCSQRPNSQGEMTPVGIPDAITVLGRYAGGAKFSFAISSVDSAAPRLEVRLNAEKGSLRYDLAAQKLYRADHGGPGVFGQADASGEVLVEPDPGTTPGWQVEADFVKSIRDGMPVTLTSFEDGLRYMRFTELVWESWNNGSKVMAWGEA